MKKKFNDASTELPLTLSRLTRRLNFYQEDGFLQSILARYDSDFLTRNTDRLQKTGAFAAGPLDVQAEQSDTERPAQLSVLSRIQVPGQEMKVLRSRVISSTAYENAHQEAYRLGAIAPSFETDANGKKEPHLLSFTMGYMLSKSDISVHCPVTMTGAVAYILEQFASQALRDKYLPELLRADGKTSTGGTWATERHGGSDVGATTTKATPAGQGPNGEKTVKLNGFKWFASNAASQIAVATARADGAGDGGKGLGLYLVPSHKPDGTPNNYTLQRLKNKMGTKGLPTGEILLEDAYAIEIVPPPHGLRIMMEALGYSRVHNAVAAAGVMHRALLEAEVWASNRETFGQPLIDRPMVQKRLLDIEMTWQAGTALAFEAAQSFDKCAATGDKMTDDKIWMRIITAIAKFKTAEQAVDCAQKALTLVGGNGYTEDFATSRIMRDAMVLPVWEGPEQIQAKELASMLFYGKEYGLGVFKARLQDKIDGIHDPALKKTFTRSFNSILRHDIPAMRKNPLVAETNADSLMNKMALLCEGIMLAGQAEWMRAAQNDGRSLELCRRFVDHHAHTLCTPLPKAVDPMIRRPRP